MAVFSLTSWIGRKLGFFGQTTVFGSGEVYAGKPVTPENALTLSTFWACVAIISESIASLPCGLFELDNRGDKVLARDEEIYRLLHDSPNANMTAVEFWQAMVSILLIWGNFYGLKTYRGSGSVRRLVSIEPLRSDLMTLHLNDDGSFTYKYSDGAGVEEYSEADIWHVKGFSLDGRIGLSVIEFARQTLGNAMALEETSGRLYSNGMRPGGALTMEGVLRQEQRDQIRKSISDQVGGVSRSGGLIVLEGNMKYQPLSMPPEDAQMLQNRAFGVEDVCRWFRVPPVLIGHGEKTTTWGTGLEQINIGFLTYTLRPWLSRIEQAIKRSLLTPAERVKLFAEFNFEGLLRADSKGRADYYSQAVNNGWMDRSEVRRKENMPYKVGSEELTVQSALVPLNRLGEVALSKGSASGGLSEDRA